jgi:GGDEF domain-containing protein
MNTMEVVIWSCMLGGLLTLGTAALADVVFNRSLSSLRGLVFLILIGSSSMLLTGLPEYLFPDLPPAGVLVLKCSLGPLAGALILTNLGLWLGVSAEDRMVGHTIVWGSAFLILSAIVLAIVIVNHTLELDKVSDLLTFTTLVNCLSIVLALFASVRAANLGDALARWMVLACLFLAISNAGLFHHALVPGGQSTFMLAVVSCSTVSFLLVIVALGITRTRILRRLEKQALNATGADPSTGLPMGSALLSKLEDAFWRSTRQSADSALICIHIHNLYDLADVGGHGIEQQILAAVTARVRRAVGFRCVVGLYHPRCFVVAVSSVRQARLVERLIERLRTVMGHTLQVVAHNGQTLRFVPRSGIGAVTVAAGQLGAVAFIEEAERKAMATLSGSNDRESTPTAAGALTSDAE